MNDPPEDREHHHPVISDAESTLIEASEQRQGNEDDEERDREEEEEELNGDEDDDDDDDDTSGSNSKNNNSAEDLAENNPNPPEHHPDCNAAGASNSMQELAEGERPVHGHNAAATTTAAATGLSGEPAVASAQQYQHNPNSSSSSNGQFPPGAYYPPFHSQQQHPTPSPQQHQQQYPSPFPISLPLLPPFPSPLMGDHHHQPPAAVAQALAHAHYFESQMRDHAAAYANAAAAAAWAAYQVAQAAHAASGGGPAAIPPPLPPSPVFGCNHHPQPTAPFPPTAPAAAGPPQGHVFYPNNMGPPLVHGSQEYQQQQQYPDHQQQYPDHQQQQHTQKSSHPRNPDNRPSHRRKRVHQRPANEIAVSQNTTTPSFSGKVRRRLRSDGDSSSSGSSFSFAHRPRTYNKKKKARSDESLLGKTAIPALHEWCSKRQRQPEFQRENSDPFEFEFTVAFKDAPENCLGRGKGTTKNAAKQLAAKRALQRLVPGLVFDEATGILVSLPKQDSPEDLAYLAKQLAIKHEDEDAVAQDSKKRPSSSPPKRTLDVYPGTSTTSEEDDENIYYTTRGASVCSSLLYAMIQIDPKIPEAPTYSYTVDQDWPGPSQNAQLRRKVASSDQSSVIRVHRGSHTCTAKLQQVQEDGTTNVLEATGTGGTKREARHTASARLLALLFPDCPSMVEVKAAAEAAREQYAASKARKHHSEQSVDSKSDANRSLQQRTPSHLARFQNDLATVLDGDVPLPSFLTDHFNSILSPDLPKCEALPEARQSSRLRQIEVEVDRALQRLKDEHDSLPEELTEDDVGRTVLRRAGAEDLPRIRKLLHEQGTLNNEEMTARLWSTSSFVLMLCRAIAAFDDPPLGCAVLSLGFDLEKGKILRVSKIGNEPHLPLERLVECLQTFAVCMNSTLVTKEIDAVETTPVRVIRSILESHLSNSPDDPLLPPVTAAAAASSSSSLHVWPLQSVKEEEESEGGSSIERRLSKQQQHAQSSKPSKRSRKK